MPRIPYVDPRISEPAELVASIRTRRGGELLNLDRMLLHSPELAAGWNLLMGAVRRRFVVSARLREIGICVVAVLNRAEYEFIHHAPELIEAGGSKAQVEALRDPQRALVNEQLFDETERQVIALTIDMTRAIEVRPGLTEWLNERLGPQQTVELVSTIAAYNMVSRLLVAVGVEPEEGR
jgi:alkylhydroperoxidase family enzyme